MVEYIVKQEDFNRMTYRVDSETPGHTTFGVWTNGGKAGHLTVSVQHTTAMHEALQRAGFKNNG